MLITRASILQPITFQLLGYQASQSASQQASQPTADSTNLHANSSRLKTVDFVFPTNMGCFSKLASETVTAPIVDQGLLDTLMLRQLTEHSTLGGYESRSRSQAIGWQYMVHNTYSC